MTKTVLQPSARRDPRYYQIAMLAGLLVYGVFALALPVGALDAVVLLGSTLAIQLVFTRWRRLPRFDPLSPLISGLSLCLLLRSGSLSILALAAAVTISSKFVLRWRGKHLFNPTNFGLVVMLLITDQVWVSPGLWGSAAYFGLLLAGLGGLVVHRAERSDVTYAFLIVHALLLAGRAWWLGDPITIPLHQLQSGALLIFAFFMISDPKTTPDSRAGRILFAAVVAVGGYLVQFGLYRPNGLLWSLATTALLVPLIDRLLPGRRYRWGKTVPAPTVHSGGPRDEAPILPAPRLPQPLPDAAR